VKVYTLEMYSDVEEGFGGSQTHIELAGVFKTYDEAKARWDNRKYKGYYYDFRINEWDFTE